MNDSLLRPFLHCFPADMPSCLQALAKALLAMAAQERLAAAIQRNAPQFELLRSFQAALSTPLAAAAVKQSLAQLQSFVASM